MTTHAVQTFCPKKGERLSDIVVAIEGLPVVSPFAGDLHSFAT